MRKSTKLFQIVFNDWDSTITVVYRFVGLDHANYELNPNRINNGEYYTTLAKAKAELKSVYKSRISGLKYALWKLNQIKSVSDLHL